MLLNRLFVCALEFLRELASNCLVQYAGSKGAKIFTAFRNLHTITQVPTSFSTSTPRRVVVRCLDGVVFLRIRVRFTLIIIIRG